MKENIKKNKKEREIKPPDPEFVELSVENEYLKVCFLHFQISKDKYFFQKK